MFKKIYKSTTSLFKDKFSKNISFNFSKKYNKHLLNISKLKFSTELKPEQMQTEKEIRKILISF